MPEYNEKGQVHLGKFEYVIQALIVLSLFCYAAQTSPNLSRGWHTGLRIFEAATVAIFTAEYLARIILSRNRLGYIFSFYGTIDLLAILPFFLATGVDLRSIRAFRLIRLFRLFKLLRYSAVVRRFQRAFHIVRDELILFGAVSLILLILSAVGIHFFENEAQPEKFSSVFACLWWAVVTLTTVGYGDAYPITVGGRMFTFVVLVIGLGIIAVPTGIFASALSQAREDEENEENEEKERDEEAGDDHSTG